MNSKIKTSIESLRIALRSADITTLDMAIDLIVYYIKNDCPHQEKLNELLMPIDNDEVFNQRIHLVKMAASV